MSKCWSVSLQMSRCFEFAYLSSHVWGLKHWIMFGYLLKNKPRSCWIISAFFFSEFSYDIFPSFWSFGLWSSCSFVAQFKVVMLGWKISNQSCAFESKIWFAWWKWKEKPWQENCCKCHPFFCCISIQSFWFWVFVNYMG